jgi:hypothetical protein
MHADDAECTRLLRKACAADAMRQAEESSGALVESQAFSRRGKARAERTQMHKVLKSLLRGIWVLADAGVQITADCRIGFSVEIVPQYPLLGT